MAALHSMAKTWKHPKCPTTEAWINKMWYTQTVEYYSVIKGTTPLAATWKQLAIILREVRQTNTI